MSDTEKRLWMKRAETAEAKLAAVTERIGRKMRSPQERVSCVQDLRDLFTHTGPNEGSND